MQNYVHKVCPVILRRRGEQWSHFTTDGGGLTFQFFWHPLSAAPDRSWQAHYQTALTFIHG